MMKDTKTSLKIGSVTFSNVKYGTDDEVAYEYTDITYTNEASDPYHSDYEVAVELDKSDAEAIIKFLQQHFKL